MKFRRRTYDIEAVQLCWRNWSDVCIFLGNMISVDNPGRSVRIYADQCGEFFGPYIEITIETVHGSVTVNHGDWICKDSEGHFYKSPSVDFPLIYEEIQDEQVPT